MYVKTADFAGSARGIPRPSSNPSPHGRLEQRSNLPNGAPPFLRPQPFRRLVEIEPSELQRLLGIEPVLIRRPCGKEIADVEVLVHRLTFAGRDVMDVDVEDSIAGELEVREATFFPGFPLRSSARSFTWIDMPSHLQPSVESPVVMKQKFLLVTVDDESGSGDMTRNEVGAGEGDIPTAHEIDEALEVGGFRRIIRLIGAQLEKKVGRDGHSRIVAALMRERATVRMVKRGQRDSRRRDSRRARRRRAVEGRERCRITA